MTIEEQTITLTLNDRELAVIQHALQNHEKYIERHDVADKTVSVSHPVRGEKRYPGHLVAELKNQLSHAL